MAAPQARAASGEAQNRAIMTLSGRASPETPAAPLRATVTTPAMAITSAAGITKAATIRIRAFSAPNRNTSGIAVLPITKEMDQPINTPTSVSTGPPAAKGPSLVRNAPTPLATSPNRMPTVQKTARAAYLARTI